MDVKKKVEATNFWSFKSTRLWLSLTFSLAVFANALIRNSLAVAVVCMVNSTYAAQDSGQSVSQLSNDTSSCSSSDSAQDYQGTFLWSTFQQGILFSAIFFGGFVTTLPAGWLADRYDPKNLASLGIFMSVLGSFLCPITAIKSGLYALVGLRFIIGMFGQALIIPSISAIIARWIPPMERSTVIGVYTAGNQLANIIGMPLNSLLCYSSFLGGWPAIFYVNGVLGAISCVLWITFASNRPETNRFISEKEKTYITYALSGQNLVARKIATKKIPWRKLLSSPPLLVCVFNSIANGAMIVTLTTYIPTYFKEALHMSLLANGFLGALPYIVQWISKIFFAVLADLIKRKTTISHTVICKIFNTFSCCGVAVFLIACSYMTCTTSGWAVAFLALALACFSAVVPGFQTSMLCIAPAYSGIINSFSRVGGQLASVFAPLIVSFLTRDETVDEWRHVFYLFAIFVLVAGLLFLIFGSASIQDWAKFPKPLAPPITTTDNNNKDKSEKNVIYLEEILKTEPITPIKF